MYMEGRLFLRLMQCLSVLGHNEELIAFGQYWDAWRGGSTSGSGDVFDTPFYFSILMVGIDSAKSDGLMGYLYSFFK